jgi:hypothetical protein
MSVHDQQKITYNHNDDLGRTAFSDGSQRLITKSQAAAYCGLSKAGFSSWVSSGKLPGPIPGTARWDIRAINVALDQLSGIGDSADVSALDRWRSNRACRS